MTLVLTRGDLQAVLRPEPCLAALRDGFRRAAEVPVAGQRADLPA